MDLKAILFDVNGTLIDIETDEQQDKIYRAISRLLNYQGLTLAPEVIRERYFQIMDQQRKSSHETHVEFDAVAIWRAMLAQAQPLNIPAAKLEQLPLFLAELHRALARKRLEAFPGVHATLADLRQRYTLAVVSDAQSAYAVAELQTVGLADFFSPIIVSGDYGYRKPDARLFTTALEKLGLRPEQAIYVGNDMYCDVFGAQQVGMKAVFFPTQWGRKEYANVNPDYIIYRFSELKNAASFLAR